MISPWIRGLCSLPLFALIGCGGSDKDSKPSYAPMTAAKGQSLANAFLTLENTQATPTSLPAWVPNPGGNALQLRNVSPTSCVTAVTQSQDPVTTVTWTFNCTGEDGGLLTGAMAITFSTASPTTYAIAYQNLKYAKGTQSWTFNGTKQVTFDLANQRTTLTTATPLTLTFADTAQPSSDRTYTYTCALTSDWRTTGTYRLWGSFSMQTTGEERVEGTMAEATALTWTPGSGCCHPISGTLALVQGNTAASLQFGTPCGTVQIIPPTGPTQTITLPACPA